MKALRPRHLINSLQKSFAPTWVDSLDEGLQQTPRYFQKDLEGLARQKLARQRELASGLPISCIRALSTHGFWVKHRALPAEYFRRLKYEAFDYLIGHRDRDPECLKSWQSAQNISLPLSYTSLLRQPFLQSAITDEVIPGPLAFAAGKRTKPVYTLQALAQNAPVFALWHGELSNSSLMVEHNARALSATAFLFLERISPEDGAFFYIPGSHRITQERIDWEYRLDLEKETDTADDLRDTQTRLSDIEPLDLPALLPIKIEPNTLLIWDRAGFHGRLPSTLTRDATHITPRLTLRADITARKS